MDAIAPAVTDLMKRAPAGAPPLQARARTHSCESERPGGRSICWIATARRCGSRLGRARFPSRSSPRCARCRSAKEWRGSRRSGVRRSPPAISIGQRRRRRAPGRQGHRLPRLDLHPNDRGRRPIVGNPRRGLRRDARVQRGRGGGFVGRGARNRGRGGARRGRSIVGDRRVERRWRESTPRDEARRNDTFGRRIRHFSTRRHAEDPRSSPRGAESWLPVRAIRPPMNPGIASPMIF